MSDAISHSIYRKYRSICISVPTLRITRITACILRIGTQEAALRGGVVAGLEVIEMGRGLAIPLLPGEALAGAVWCPERVGAPGLPGINLFAIGQVVV